MLITRCRCLALDPPELCPRDVRIRNGRIAEVGESLQPEEGEPVDDMCGRILMPGMVCAHTHLYSSLATGMPISGRTPQAFIDILRRVWWRLDRALDDEAIGACALVGALEALRCGTTTMIDHHSSPNAIGGSLDIIGNAILSAGARGVLCYEVTDRNGRVGRERGLCENDRFIREHRDDPFLRGMVGAHAPFTLSDASLQACREIADSLGTGVHLHLGEDRIDISRAQRLGTTPARRLRKSGLLRENSIYAHCVHLTRDDLSLVRGSGGWLVHNPRSNMNNRVGYAPLKAFGTRAALGTDGFVADMLDEARLAFLRNRESASRLTPEGILSLLSGGHRLASALFGMPIGRIAKGAVADLVVMDYDAPTPVEAGNIGSHVLSGGLRGTVRSVMVGGEWVMRDRRALKLNEDAVFSEARKIAQKLWNRLEST